MIPRNAFEKLIEVHQELAQKGKAEVMSQSQILIIQLLLDTRSLVQQLVKKK